MKIITVIIHFIIEKFGIELKKDSYRSVLLVISLIMTSFAYFAFAILSFLTRSFYLSIILTTGALLSVFFLYYLKKHQNFKSISLLFILTYILIHAYFVFDSGSRGYGFLWFFVIPLVVISILGNKKGSIVFLSFLAYLSLVFLTLPDYIIAIDYTKDLQSRLVISLFSEYLLLIFWQWTLLLFQKNKAKKDEDIEDVIHYNKEITAKLSRQLKLLSTGIIKNSKFSDRYILDPHVKNLMQNIQSSSLSMQNIIDNIIEYSEINVLEHASKSYYLLQAVIDNTVDLFRMDYPNIYLKIDSLLPAEVYGNQLVIKQILYKFIANVTSIKALKSGTRIDINVAREQENEASFFIRYKIIISNKAKSFSVKCSNLKSETDPTKEKKYIKKYNLKTLYSLVNDIEGSFIFEETNEGIVFCFYQKIDKTKKTYKKISIAEYQLKKVEKKEDVVKLFSKKQLSKISVLLMDPNPITQKTILVALESTVKKIDIVDNGKNGLDLFVKNKYDIILTSINMPIADGYVTAEKIRNVELGTRFHIPIIAVISDIQLKDINKILSSGIDDYIQKPFKPNDLLYKLHKHIKDN